MLILTNPFLFCLLVYIPLKKYLLKLLLALTNALLFDSSVDIPSWGGWEDESLHFQAQQAEVVLIGMKALLLSMHCWRTIGIEFSLGPLTLWRSSTGRRRNESLGWQVTPCCFLVEIELYGAPLHHKVDHPTPVTATGERYVYIYIYINQPPLGANDFTSFQVSW